MSASESLRAAALVFATALTCGCSTPGSDLRPIERLDPLSAVVTTIMSEPWVYARDVPALAANARDYLNVGVVETNRAGQRAYWLGVVSWSTLDRSALPAATARPAPGRLRFVWSDHSLDFASVPAGRNAIGSTEPIFAPAQPVFQDAWFALTPSELDALAAEPPVRIEFLLPEGRAATYDRWHVDTDVLASLLEATGFGGGAVRR